MPRPEPAPARPLRDQLLLNSSVVPFLGKMLARLAKNRVTTSFQHRVHDPPTCMAKCSSAGGRPSQLRCAVPAQTLRAQPRQAAQSEVSARSEAPRTLDKRLQHEEVRGPQQAHATVSKATSASAGRGSKGGEAPWPQDGKLWLSSSSYEAPWVVELFSSCARLSSACNSVGFNCAALDIEYGPGCDILKISVQKQLFEFLGHHDIALVWIGMPCTSWSRARKFDNLGPPPLRDDSQFLWGRPGLSKRDSQKVQDGNNLLAITRRVIDFCQKHSLRWVLENPFSSRAWLTSTLREMLSVAKLLRVDYYQYREPWQKPTGLLAYPYAWLQPLAKQCNSVGNRCSASGRPHIKLVGTDISGVFMTLRAQPYPKALCAAIVASLQVQCL